MTLSSRRGLAAVFPVAFLGLAFWCGRDTSKVVRADAPAPVLVELFTSEGCSSCPPADRLLQKLDAQPIAGARMIVLSEHVDYWNHIGWKDPYSSHLYSDRQSAYANRFGLGSVYTPQMVVDGTTQFVGSDSALADKAFQQALTTVKISVHLSPLSPEPVSLTSSNALRVHLEVGQLDESLGLRDADIYLAVALSHAESHVAAGENAGHTLAHVAVVESLAKIGVVKRGQPWIQDVQVKVAPGSDLRNLRLVAFVQQSQQGRILGADMLTVGQTSRVFLFRGLGQNQKHNRHGDQVPQNGGDPYADRVGGSLTLGAALRPIFLPQPGLVGILRLKPLLTLQKFRAIQGDEHQPKPDAAEGDAEGEGVPERCVDDTDLPSRIIRSGLRQADRLPNCEQAKPGEGKAEPTQQQPATLGRAFHCTQLSIGLAASGRRGRAT
jgi:hypothetical protein